MHIAKIYINRSLLSVVVSSSTWLLDLLSLDTLEQIYMLTPVLNIGLNIVFCLLSTAYLPEACERLIIGL